MTAQQRSAAIREYISVKEKEESSETVALMHIDKNQAGETETTNIAQPR